MQLCLLSYADVVEHVITKLCSLDRMKNWYLTKMHGYTQNGTFAINAINGLDTETCVQRTLTIQDASVSTICSNYPTQQVHAYNSFSSNSSYHTCFLPTLSKAEYYT